MDSQAHLHELLLWGPAQMSEALFSLLWELREWGLNVLPVRSDFQ